MIRSLYLKIFLWFWLALVLIALVMIFAVPRPPRDPREDRWRDITGTTLTIYAPHVAEKIEREGVSTLPAYLDEIGITARAKVLIYDQQDKELLGRSGPPDVSRILDEAKQRSGTTFENDGDMMLAAHTSSSGSGATYVLLAMNPLPQRPGPPLLDPHSLPLRLIAVFITGTVVCYALARYVTAPVVKLRSATHQLADGDLSVRVGSKIGSRRDELADLARDFDSMALRLDSLINGQRRLLGDISHELRSPLARLNVALELARQRSGPEAKSAHDRIEREAERLNLLIGQLLTITRLENDVDGITRQRVDLATLVREVASDADFESRVMRRGVRVTGSDECAVHGNPELLRSAVENVVRNAVSYTAQDTEVEVALRRVQSSGQGEAVVTVRDHGPGAPETVLGDLFKPFYRVDDARDRQTGGAGLGLAITDRAVRLHGGIVRAENAVGGGLAVEIRLPLSHT